MRTWVEERARTSGKAKRALAWRGCVYHTRATKRRAGEQFIFQVWITRRIPWQRGAATDVQRFHIYVYKILFCAWRRRLTCRRPWTAWRPIKTRRAGRAQWKSGAAAVTTIKWPRTSIDIGIYNPPHAALATRSAITLQRAPTAASGRRLMRTVRDTSLPNIYRWTVGYSHDILCHRCCRSSGYYILFQFILKYIYIPTYIYLT